MLYKLNKVLKIYRLKVLIFFAVKSGCLEILTKNFLT